MKEVKEGVTRFAGIHGEADGGEEVGDGGDIGLEGGLVADGGGVSDEEQVVCVLDQTRPCRRIDGRDVVGGDVEEQGAEETSLGNTQWDQDDSTSATRTLA